MPSSALSEYALLFACFLICLESSGPEGKKILRTHKKREFFLRHYEGTQRAFFVFTVTGDGHTARKGDAKREKEGGVNE